MAKTKSVAHRHDGIVESWRIRIYKDYIGLSEGGSYGLPYDAINIPLDVWNELVKFYNLNKKKKIKS